MRNLIVALATSLFVSTFVAASPVAAQKPSARNADPVGLELGVATVAQTREKYGELGDRGVNTITGGKMLSVAKPGFGPEGTQEILFVFDKGQRLAGVLMTLPKGGAATFNEMADSLRKKYRQTARNVPFVGDAIARYEQGDSVVIYEAPHMSFTSTITYMTKDLQRAINAAQAAKNQESKRRTEDGV